MGIERDSFLLEVLQHVDSPQPKFWSDHDEVMEGEPCLSLLRDALKPRQYMDRSTAAACSLCTIGNDARHIDSDLCDSGSVRCHKCCSNVHRYDYVRCDCGCGACHECLRLRCHDCRACNEQCTQCLPIQVVAAYKAMRHELAKLATPLCPILVPFSNNARPACNGIGGSATTLGPRLPRNK